MGGRGCVPGVARARCPVFIALANRSIADSDTAQLGSPRTELETPLLPPRLLSPFCPCPSLSLSELLASPPCVHPLPDLLLARPPLSYQGFFLPLSCVYIFHLPLFFPFFLFLFFSLSLSLASAFRSINLPSLNLIFFFSGNIAIGTEKGKKREDFPPGY